MCLCTLLWMEKGTISKESDYDTEYWRQTLADWMRECWDCLLNVKVVRILFWEIWKVVCPVVVFKQKNVTKTAQTLYKHQHCHTPSNHIWRLNVISFSNHIRYWWRNLLRLRLGSRCLFLVHLAASAINADDDADHDQHGHSEHDHVDPLKLNAPNLECLAL